MLKSKLLTIINFFGLKGKIILFFILCFISFLIWIQFHNTRIAKDKIEFLFKKGVFTTGEVNGVNYSGGVNGSPSNVSDIMYFFYVDNKKYDDYLSLSIAIEISKESKNKFVGFDRSRQGEKFLVLYEKNNPKNSILLVDRPIRDNKDFEKYKTEFEENRKTF